jgi:hypothetical protein
MRTLIVTMQYTGIVLTTFGVFFAIGMMVADDAYKRVLGASLYYDMDALSTWDVGGVLAVGFTILVVSYILDGVFKAGEKSATKEEDE